MALCRHSKDVCRSQMFHTSSTYGLTPEMSVFLLCSCVLAHLFPDEMTNGMHWFQYCVTVVNQFPDVYMQLIFGKTTDALAEGPPSASCALWHAPAFACEGFFRLSPLSNGSPKGLRGGEWRRENESCLKKSNFSILKPAWEILPDLTPVVCCGLVK